MDEFTRIRQWTQGRQSAEWLRAQGVVVGIGDDAAVVELAPPGSRGNTGDSSGLGNSGSSGLQWLFAMDTMVETVHFAAGTMSDADIGYKALAANISDIAAMGGEPRYALVSVSVPKGYAAARMERLYEGLYACANQYGVAIIGGDTTSAPAHLVVAVTVAGTVASGQAIMRSGARLGDAVFVTGLPGRSAAGLHALLAGGQGVLASRQGVQAGEQGAASGLTRSPGPAQSQAVEQAVEQDKAPLAQPPEQARYEHVLRRLVQAHQRPQPSVQAGRLLAASGSCHALNDVSDGVASETWELAEASGVCIALRKDWLPLSESLTLYAAACGKDPLEWLLYGGEDYVLLGTMDAQAVPAMKAAFGAQGIPIYRIGTVTSADGAAVTLLEDGRDTAGKPLAKRGYNHFAENDG